MQSSIKKGVAVKGRAGSEGLLTLDRLNEGEEAVLVRIDLPEEDARRLMELGFVPGVEIVAARKSPFGDPRVFRVDGCEVALRRETAAQLYIRLPKTATESGYERLP